MALNIHKRTVLMLSIIMISGCSSNLEITDQTIFDERDQVDAKPLYEPQTVAERRAYSAGVNDMLSDLKGKMQASQDFVYERTVVSCGIKVPGRVVGGMFIPEHEECGILKPGAFVEKAPVYLPVIGN